MSNFVKLYGSILDSTVWQESLPTKVVWITMLAMADAEGFVAASVPGLTKRAGVTRAQCESAIRVLSEPDPDSKTTDHEGRRIEAVDGGWVILNHRKYRDLRTDTQIATAERVRKHRERQKESVTVTDVTDGNDEQRAVRAEEEEEAYTEADTSIHLRRSLSLRSSPNCQPTRTPSTGTRSSQAGCRGSASRAGSALPTRTSRPDSPNI